MSELDKNRRINLLNNISGNQVFITCTDKIEINKSENSLNRIENGKRINI